MLHHILREMAWTDCKSFALVLLTTIVFLTEGGLVDDAKVKPDSMTGGFFPDCSFNNEGCKFTNGSAAAKPWQGASQDETVTPTNAFVVPIQVLLQTTDDTTTLPVILNPYINCNFEEGGICNWQIKNDTGFSWVYIRAGTASRTSGGPLFDHTLHDLGGHYLLASSKAENLNQTTRFESQLQSTTSARCLKFYYHAYGRGVGLLNVLVNFLQKPEDQPSEDQVLWSRHSPDEGKVWQLGQTDIPTSTGSMTIIFEAVAGSGVGDIALDDIVSDFSECHSNDNVCDFEKSRCNFRDSSEDGVMTWQVVTPSSFPQVIGTPNVDITLGTRNGHFLMAHKLTSANSSRALIETADYASSDADRCFQFFYRFDARPNVVDSFLVSLTWEMQTDLMLNVTDNQGAQWHISNFNVAPGGRFSVQFEAILSIGTVVAIDDVYVNEGFCSHPLDCQFDAESSCLWTQTFETPTDQFDWQIVSPRSLTTPGPAKDHTFTTNEGWMALASGPGNMVDMKAWLLSPQIEPYRYVCLTFWYYFSRYTTGKPSVLRGLGVDVNDNFQTKYWTLDQTTAPLPGQWLSAQFGRARNWNQKIALEAIMGEEPNSYIAVDDILVKGGVCDIFPEQASPTYKPTTPQPTTAPAFEFTCDFEDGTMCVFENDAAATSESCHWINRKGRNSSMDTGPSSDHTLQNSDGSYLYFQASKCYMDPFTFVVGLTTKSSLTSFRDTAQCLQFWYYMYGAPISNALMISTSFSDGDQKLEFLRRNNQGDQWLAADVTIDNENKIDYSITFQATRSLSRFGDIALDDISVRDGACPSIKDLCDFENKDFCDFRVVLPFGNEQFRWNSAKAGSLDGMSTEAFPDGMDHTFMAPDGHVAYVDGTGLPKGTQTYMVSPPQTILEYTDQCITFWYQIPLLPSGGKLQVYLLRANQDNIFINPVWAVSDGFQITWEYATVPIAMGEDYKFAFGARNGVNTFFALDDISVIKEKCPKPLSCDFEDGLCGWTNAFLDDFDWLIFRGATSTGDTARPTVDHTLNSSEGHYVYIDNEHPSQKNYDSADLVSQRVQVLEGKPVDWCFRFWYHMYTDPMSNASLELLVHQSGQNEARLLLIDTSQRNMWIPRMVNIQVSSDFRLRFKGTVEGERGKSDIALDDFSAENSICPTQPPSMFHCPDENVIIGSHQVCDQIKDCTSGADEAECGSCSFDSGSNMCGYSIFRDDDFSWVTESFGSAPQTSFASFMYANFSKGGLRSSTYLDSPWLHETSATCQIAFWYALSSLSSNDSGTLIVSLQLDDTETVLAVIDQNYLSMGEPVSYWKEYNADLGRMSGQFRLIFRARKGSSATGSISLDDIRMNSCDFPAPTSGDCPTDGWKCSTTKVCISDDQRCDFTDDCGKLEDETNCSVTHPVRCNFENDLCDWSHSASNDVNWVQTNRRTSTAFSGPLRDHTTGLRDGGFALLRSSPNSSDIGKNATLLSPLFASRTLQDNCRLRFFFHMYGSTMGELVIWTVTDVSTNREDIAKGDQGDVWHGKSILLSSSVSFRVAFHGTIGGNRSDIAIDDVSFSENCRLAGSLNPSTTVPSTSTEPNLMTSDSTTSLTTMTILTTLSTIRVSSSTQPTTDLISTKDSTVLPNPVSSNGTTMVTNKITSSSANTTLVQSASTEPVTEATHGFPGHDPGMSTGAIVGIVLGVIFGVMIATGGIFLVVRRRRRAAGEHATDSKVTSGYKIFGEMDGFTSNHEDGTEINHNAVFSDLYSDDL